MNFRFIFHNPHTNIWYKRPLYFFLTKRKSVDKYEYLLDYCLQNKVNFAFLVDGSDFSFGRSFFKGSFMARLEVLAWCMINRINPFSIKIISRFDKLKQNDVVFSFLYGNLLTVFDAANRGQEKLIHNLRSTKAYTVVHVTHYMYNVLQASENTERAEIDLLMAENNLAKNSRFFQDHFGWYKKDVLSIPFVAQRRFIRTKPFAERKNKAIATGTLPVKMTDQAFLSYFPQGDIHPMRRALYEHKQELSEIIDCFISDATEGKKVPVNEKKANPFTKIYAQIYKNFFVKQKKYFSFNIVDSYNSYKMFIVPEEINGLPGIGFIEGMSCGTAYIGKEDPMYTDLGMLPGVHYIAYDGTLPDLINKVQYYLVHPVELEQIAEQGYRFTQEHIQPEIICKKIFREIESRLKTELIPVN